MLLCKLYIILTMFFSVSAERRNIQAAHYREKMCFFYPESASGGREFPQKSKFQ